ncbi:MAG TPA: hypothetical protein PKN87_04515 [Syntrophomonadaceae bacterium]|nr:hypothetical protein [Syntrophomonadaceae bacterium]HPR93542.1 hypothetical protein [Syntrophomonadaceae bacterium]
MGNYDVSPRLVSQIEEIIDHDIFVMGKLAAIVDEIRDPVLRAIVTSIIGDENGHVRFFRSLLVHVKEGSPNHCCYRYNRTRKKSNYVKPYRT